MAKCWEKQTSNI